MRSCLLLSLFAQGVSRKLAGLLLGLALLLTLAAGSSLAAERPRLLVIGATARSSAEIIGQGLAAGYEIVGIARRPGQVTLKDPHLTVRQGDVYDPASLEAAMSGHETVISMVGPRVDPMQEVPADFDLFTTGTANIIAAMKKKGNRRLLVASSLGVEDEFPTEKPPPGDPRLNWLYNSRYLYQDMGNMEQLVRESGIEFVIFRPPFLVEEPARNDYRLSIDAESPKGTMMTYADFAAFVLAQVRSAEYLGRSVGLYTERPVRFGENVDLEKLMQEAQQKARQEAD